MKKLFLLLLFAPCTVFAQVEYPAGQVAHIEFTTRNTSGVPTALTGGSVVCHKSGVATDITAGITLTVNFSGRTGSNNVDVDTSAASATYTAGSVFWCSLSAGTVGGSSVIAEVIGGFKVGSQFTVQKAVAFANYPIIMQSAAGAAVVGISPTCTIQKDSGAFAASTNTVVEISSGKYRLDLTSTETNANIVTLICTGTGSVAYRANIFPQQ